MQPTRTDFYEQLARAAGLTMDATCVARAAGHLPLPHPHRRLLNAAVRKLEGAQQDLFDARNNAWAQPQTPRQLELL